MNRIKESILSMVVSDSFDIRTRNAGIFRFPASYRYEMHAHCEIEINYVNSGSCIMVVEGVFIPLKRGDCIIIYAGVQHQFIVDDKENCRITQLEFEVLNLPEKAKAMCFFRMSMPYIRLRGCEAMCEYMESLCRIRRYEKDNENREMLVQLGYFQLYICTLRLGKAKELLWFSSKSVTEIAMDTGFGSSQYFCRVFQKHEHMSPMEYRNLWKKQEPKGLSRTKQ